VLLMPTAKRRVAVTVLLACAPPGVLCKRRRILCFAGGLCRIMGAATLRGGDVRVPVRLQRRFC
jgi:hypothetical protein